MSISITNEQISQFRNNDSLIYSFISPSNGIFDVEISSSIAISNPGFLYADIDYDLQALIKMDEMLQIWLKNLVQKEIKIFKKLFMVVFIWKKIKNSF